MFMRKRLLIRPYSRAMLRDPMVVLGGVRLLMGEIPM